MPSKALRDFKGFVKPEKIFKRPYKAKALQGKPQEESGIRAAL
jgi:hypothetical protein